MNSSLLYRFYWTGMLSEPYTNFTQMTYTGFNASVYTNPVNDMYYGGIEKTA